MGATTSTLFEAIPGGLGIVTAVFIIITGLISLLFGRKLFWLYVGLAGFLLGLLIGPEFLGDLEPTLQPFIILLIGIVFAFLSIITSKIMIAISGAIWIGALAYGLIQPITPGWLTLLLTFFGAMIGLLVAWFIFDWGLMIFSSIAGASLISSGLIVLIPEASPAGFLTFLPLFALGLIFQITQWSRSRG